MLRELELGIFGMGTSLAAVGITLTNFEAWIRVAGSLVALAIGVMTLVKMMRERK